jgi:hypothetical protein
MPLSCFISLRFPIEITNLLFFTRIPRKKFIPEKTKNKTSTPHLKKKHLLLTFFKEKKTRMFCNLALKIKKIVSF